MKFTMRQDFGPGFEDLLKRLGDGNIRDVVASALNVTAVEGQGVIRRATPVDSGNLVNSIQVRTTDRNELNAEIFTNCEYAIFVEFGTGIHNELSEAAKASGWKGQRAAAMFRSSQPEIKRILRTRVTEALQAHLRGDK